MQRCAMNVPHVTNALCAAVWRENQFLAQFFSFRIVAKYIMYYIKIPTAQIFQLII